MRADLVYRADALQEQVFRVETERFALPGWDACKIEELEALDLEISKLAQGITEFAKHQPLTLQVEAS